MRTIRLQGKEWCDIAWTSMKKTHYPFCLPQIINLSGELEEEIYVAIFNDDSRILFHVDVLADHIELIFPNCPFGQGADYDDLTAKEQEYILLSVLFAFTLNECVKLDDCSYWD